MVKGDLVRVKHKRNLVPGILIKRTYLAYENAHSRWDILLEGGEVVNLRESSIRKGVSYEAL